LNPKPRNGIFRYLNTKLKQWLLLVSIGVLLASCSVVKRVKDGDYLLTENTIEVDSKTVKNERISNIPLQKPNSGMNGIISFPAKLHIYNLARPNIDSILKAKVYDDSAKVRRKTKWLSRKQLDKSIKSHINFNSWLKRNGEAPTIFDITKTEKTQNRLKAYYYKQGWFDNGVSFTVEKDSNKRAKVRYKVTKNEPYILDSISTTIQTPVIDSIYNAHLDESLIKPGQQYNEAVFTEERSRINTLMRNSGAYFFGQDYVRFEIDTFKSKHTYNSELFIDNRIIRTEDSTRTEPFKIYTIKDVNIFTDATNENRIAKKQITDSTTFNGYNLYSFDKLKFKPKALTDAVYSDLNRARTSRYLNQLQMFRYPGVDFVPNEQDSTLTANIYLSPRKKYDLGFSFDVSQSNIQTIGFSFRTGLKIRNLFRGAETLDISFLGAIGASEDPSDDEDTFFDINEFGGTVGLTIPRLFLPFNTDKIIPKYMSPSTRINVTATSQQNIGLDRQTLSSIFSYNWFPSETVTNTLELLNIQYVRNLNPENYFGVYGNSFDRLNTIARDIDYIADDESLQNDELPNRFDPADIFIDDVLGGNTVLTPSDADYIDVNNINQRQDRLTEDNLILSSSFDYKIDTRASLSDNSFSTFKIHAEVAGSILSGIADLTGINRNDDNRYEIFGVVFSQYFKTELDYVKYFDLSGKKSVLAFRSYFGVAIPFGNSSNIPFVESFFAGGPNDNRAWTVFSLGPGRSQNTNEFNEANLKLHFSLEQRFNLFGNVDGALFIDAGNIWNAFGNVEDDPASTFNNLDALRDIAVGSGFGLRYDFQFFVIRGDIGFKTYDPSLMEGNRWFTNYNFSRATYNIGINYPF